MMKSKMMIGWLLLTMAFGSNAHDTTTHKELQKPTDQHKIVVAMIAAEIYVDLDETFPELVSDQNNTNNQWQSIDNWKKLERGMKPAQVREILGEPIKIESGSSIKWHYGNDATVEFDDEGVNEWQEIKTR